MEQANYKINLELFEGPLDLLLHLIRKNDLSISDIPVALILDQYLGYLDLLEELDIDMAGEFILLASELTHIKSRMLLAKDDEESEEPDPRADLIARLLTYQKFKNAAAVLLARPMLNREVFKRPPAPRDEEQGEPEIFLEVQPFTLLTLFYDILKKAPKKAVHEIEGERISVTERIYQIVERLKTVDNLLFESFFEGAASRGDIVITFLAILEMTRLKMIRIYQTDWQGTIHVKSVMEVAAEQLH